MRISDWSSDVCSSDLRRARAIAVAGTISETPVRRWTHAIDAVALHPVAGLVLLTAILFLMFQAVFTWAVVPADAIDAGFANLGNAVRATMSDGGLRSLLAAGVFAGAGAGVVLLPQILHHVFFIPLSQAPVLLVRVAEGREG